MPTPIQTSVQRREERRERAAARALARSMVYRLLSQALIYPEREALSALRDADVPQALHARSFLPARLAPPLEHLAEELRRTDAPALQLEHRRIFSHVQSADCPPCETAYTAQNIFQETQELSDLGGFFRAFGLELTARERPDHIAVELEFMHLLTYKEAYALVLHGMDDARFCRTVQRTFMQDHLGRWTPPFVERLARKAGGGYYWALAGLAASFVSDEIALLRARPEVATAQPRVREPAPDDFTCPMAEACLLQESGGSDASV